MKNKTEHLFSNEYLRKLLVPIIIEQLLSSLIGMVDTMMVSNVGSAAISAVSLVDSLNFLVIQLFSALAAGGTILCSQFLGRNDLEKSKKAAEQVLLVTTLLATGLAALCLIFQVPLLRLVFGAIEEDVMVNSRIYFFITLLSFPAIGLYNAGTSILRAQNNSKDPMVISVISNIMNIIGNALLIWVFHLGVAGAAISTLISRTYCAIAVTWILRNERNQIWIKHYSKIRPDWGLTKKILAVGIPSGIEGSMFQFGKVAIQSTVSTLGTAAIAAQALTSILENVNGVAAMGMGIGLMPIVGQCIGAKRNDEAIYYTKKLSWIAEVILIISCAAVFILTKPVILLAGLEPESAKLCYDMMIFITIVKPITWIPAWIPPHSLRAAGDVRYSMIVSCASMWICRVSLCVFLIRVLHLGPIAVWISMCADWTVRGIFYLGRFHSRKWLKHKVI